MYKEKKKKKALGLTYKKPEIIKMGDLKTETLGNHSGGLPDKKSGVKKPK